MVEESKEITIKEEPIERQDNQQEDSQQMSQDELLIKVGSVQMAEKLKAKSQPSQDVPSMG